MLKCLRSPGPWHIGRPSPDIRAPYTVRDAHGWDVAHCFGDHAQANATLIRNSLALLNALTDLVNRCDGAEGMRADGSNIDTLRAHVAIAEALGYSLFATEDDREDFDIRR